MRSDSQVTRHHDHEGIAWQGFGPAPTGGTHQRQDSGDRGEAAHRWKATPERRICRPRSAPRLGAVVTGYTVLMADTVARTSDDVRPESGAPRTLVARFGSYVRLTKPRIIELLLITTVPAMVLAARGWPGTWLVVSTLIGGTLSAGGANAINNYVDRDIDRVMRRTSSRPLPNDEVEPAAALRLGVGLGVLGFVVLWMTSNLLAASVSALALLFYVFVYSLYLKRTTAQNIVIGGAARRRSGARRLGRSHRIAGITGLGSLRGRFLLDPTAFLGVGAEVSRRLRGCWGADVAGGGRR